MKYGEFVTVTQRYFSKSFVDKDGVDQRRWNIMPISPVNCLCIGFRTVFEGWTDRGNLDYWDEPAPAIFHPTRGVYCALVVKGPRSKPFYVPLEERE